MGREKREKKEEREDRNQLKRREGERRGEKRGPDEEKAEKREQRQGCSRLPSPSFLLIVDSIHPFAFHYTGIRIRKGGRGEWRWRGVERGVEGDGEVRKGRWREVERWRGGGEGKVERGGGNVERGGKSGEVWKERWRDVGGSGEVWRSGEMEREVKRWRER